MNGWEYLVCDVKDFRMIGHEPQRGALDEALNHFGADGCELVESVAPQQLGTTTSLTLIFKRPKP